MSQREHAKAMGVSVSGIHYVLKTLVGNGFVKLGNFSASMNKRRYANLLTLQGIAEKATLTQAFLARKRAGCDALRKKDFALADRILEEGDGSDADALRATLSGICITLVCTSEDVAGCVPRSPIARLWP